MVCQRFVLSLYIDTYTLPYNHKIQRYYIHYDCISFIYIYEYSLPIIGLKYNSIFFFGIGMILYQYLKTNNFSIHIPLYFESFIYICFSILFTISIHLRKTLFHVDGFYFAIYIIFATISIIFILLRFNDKLSISQFPFNQG